MNVYISSLIDDIMRALFNQSIETVCYKHTKKRKTKRWRLLRADFTQSIHSHKIVVYIWSAIFEIIHVLKISMFLSLVVLCFHNAYKVYIWNIQTILVLKKRKSCIFFPRKIATKFLYFIYFCKCINQLNLEVWV